MSRASHFVGTADLPQ